MKAEYCYAVAAVVFALLSVAAGADRDTLTRVGEGLLACAFLGAMLITASRNRYYEQQAANDE